MFRTFLAGVAGAIAISACTAAPVTEAQGHTVSRAIVTPEQATRAFEITRGIDYLPWGYTADGCYSRALYMSMELAAESIPSSSQYLVANDGAVLAPGGEIFWGWHVAPMVKIGGDGEPLILDPALFAGPESARSLDAWVARSNPIPADAYRTYLVEGSHYWQIGQLVDTAPIASFEELDRFRARDIESACTIAWIYLGSESPGEPDLVAAKREKLVGRTRDLVGALKTVDKLDDPEVVDVPCPGNPARGP